MLAPPAKWRAEEALIVPIVGASRGAVRVYVCGQQGCPFDPEALLSVHLSPGHMNQAAQAQAVPGLLACCVGVRGWPATPGWP